MDFPGKRETGPWRKAFDFGGKADQAFKSVGVVKDKQLHKDLAGKDSESSEAGKGLGLLNQSVEEETSKESIRVQKERIWSYLGWVKHIKR